MQDLNEDLTNRIAAASDLTPETARAAVGVILAFLKKEGPRAGIDDLFSHFPGAAEAANASADGGGALADLMSLMGGGLMSLAARLSGLGLSMTQMEQVGRELFAYAKEKAGRDRVRAAAESIPGLSRFL